MNTSVNVSAPGVSANIKLVNVVEVAGRFLLSLLFLLSGLGKVGIATEVLGGLAIVLGWKTRVVAFLLAGFSLLTAITFHRNLADQTQMIMFFKNLSIAGGFLLLVANGAGPLSLDRRSAQKR